MRKITNEAVACLKSGRAFNKSNTSVYFLHGMRGMDLHGNHIASYDGENHKLLIRDAGRKTSTTQERLNGILVELRVGTLRRKKGTRILNSWKNGPQERDGSTLVLDLWNY